MTVEGVEGLTPNLARLGMECVSSAVGRAILPTDVSLMQMLEVDLAVKGDHRKRYNPFNNIPLKRRKEMQRVGSTIRAVLMHFAKRRILESRDLRSLFVAT